MTRRARMLSDFRILPVIAFLSVFPGLIAPANAGAEVGVQLNFNVGPPPVFAAPPPELVLMPGTGIYFAPGYPTDVFFVDGFWWAPRGPRWYRARSPRGPWIFTEVRAVPAPLFRVPRDYRTVYVRERHIPYGQWKKEHRGRGGDRRPWDRGERRHGHRDD